MSKSKQDTSTGNETDYGQKTSTGSGTYSGEATTSGIQIYNSNLPTDEAANEQSDMVFQNKNVYYCKKPNTRKLNVKKREWGLLKDFVWTFLETMFVNIYNAFFFALSDSNISIDILLIVYY